MNFLSGTKIIVVCLATALLLPRIMQAVIREIDHSNINKVWQPVDGKYPHKWSILIPSLTDRLQFLNYIVTKLQKQIDEQGLNDQIEILTFIDNRTYTIGFARNVLVRQSMGEYVAFIDDDDDVSKTYIIDIFDATKTNPDSIGIKGLHTYQDEKPFYFFQSARFKVQLHNFKMLDAQDYQWDSPNYQWGFIQSPEKFYRVECRRLSVWNPIRRSIIIKFPFPHQNMGEDMNYADKIMKSNLLKTEAVVQKACYHYCNNTAHSVGHDPLINKPRKA